MKPLSENVDILKCHSKGIDENLEIPISNVQSADDQETVKETNPNAMDCGSYFDLMHLWGIDRIDSKRGFQWKVIFSQFFSKFHFDKFAPDVSADEMAYTAELAERMANFVLEDDCTKK
uniref:ULP_PROTEASE domain-containing protein n=2 Tax=Loa loa TaxID=7209 RepID=A0A1I7VQP4_LOALO